LVTLREARRFRQSPTPVFINLDNVLTVERQDDLTTVVMVGGEKVYIDTMPETLIGAIAPGVLCSLRASRTESRTIELSSWGDR
jgi:hypothetical protein